MSIYTIIGGMNGAGKSSLLGALNSLRSDMGVIIDTNELIAEHNGNMLKGGKEAVRIISDCLDKFVNFTQETTLSGNKTLHTIIAAREKDYYIRLYYVGVSSAAESLSRIANRVKKGGHNIPENDVVRRYEKRYEDLAKILPYCNEVHFYDNENGFIDVGEYQNGAIVSKGAYTPEWLEMLGDYLSNK